MVDNGNNIGNTFMDYVQRPGNTVAKIFKGYAIVNFIAGMIIFLAMEAFEDGILGILCLAGLLVVCFCIYAVGEVVQLLEDIKQNTARNGVASANREKNMSNNSYAYYNSNVEPNSSTNMPENKQVLFCPNCGKPVGSTDQKNCMYCGSPLEW